MSVSDLLKQAIDEVGRLNPGEEFLVKDLFKGYEWKRLPLADRLLLGTLFLRYCNGEGSDVTAVDKTSSKQQVYRKV